MRFVDGCVRSLKSTDDILTCQKISWQYKEVLDLVKQARSHIYQNHGQYDVLHSPVWCTVREDGCLIRHRTWPMHMLWLNFAGTEPLERRIAFTLIPHRARCMHSVVEDPIILISEWLGFRRAKCLQDRKGDQPTLSSLRDVLCQV